MRAIPQLGMLLILACGCNNASDRRRITGLEYYQGESALREQHRQWDLQTELTELRGRIELLEDEVVRLRGKSK